MLRCKMIQMLLHHFVTLANRGLPHPALPSQRLPTIILQTTIFLPGPSSLPSETLPPYTQTNPRHIRIPITHLIPTRLSHLTGISHRPPTQPRLIPADGPRSAPHSALPSHLQLTYILRTQHRPSARPPPSLGPRPGSTTNAAPTQDLAGRVPIRPALRSVRMYMQWED